MWLYNGNQEWYHRSAGVKMTGKKSTKFAEIFETSKLKFFQKLILDEVKQAHRAQSRSQGPTGPHTSSKSSA